MPLLTPGLVAAYRRSLYTAGGATARIGRRSREVDAALRRLGVRQGAFVTAWNPCSRRMPKGWNERAMARLEEAARRLPRLHGEGGTQEWSEPQLLLGADPRRVAMLARRFRQHAIVAVRRGAPARLVILTPPALRRPGCQVPHREGS